MAPGWTISLADIYERDYAPASRPPGPRDLASGSFVMNEL
jgi:hypothetical protein